MGKSSHAGRNSSQPNVNNNKQATDKLPVAADNDPSQSNVKVESTLNDTSQQNMETENNDRPSTIQTTQGVSSHVFDDDKKEHDKKELLDVKLPQNRHSSAAILNTPTTTTDTNNLDKKQSKQENTSQLVIGTTTPIIEEEANEQDNSQNYESNLRLEDGSVYTGHIKRITNETTKSKKSKGKKNKAPELPIKRAIQHGTGKLKLVNGDIIEGEWNNGEIAQGTIVKANRDVYTGEMQALVPHGFGEMQRDVDGAVIKGTWEQGDISKGTEVMADGEVYTGQFINMKRHGMGECTYPKKQQVFQGQWECGQIKGQGVYVNLTKEAGLSSNPNYIGSTDIINNNGCINFDGMGKVEVEVNEQDLLLPHLASKFSPNDQIVEDAINQHEEELDEIRNQFDDDHGIEMYGNIQEFKGEPKNGVIATHRKQYFKFVKRRQDDEEANYMAYAKLKKDLQEKPIYATKYAHNLEGAIMNHFQYECKIQLSKDGKSLDITNRKLNTTPPYRKETTPDELMEQKQQAKFAKEQGKEYVPEQDVKQDDFLWSDSSFTCKLSDIQGIIYGGYSSRFWIYRKHMIALDAHALLMDNEIPNYNPEYPGYMNGLPEDAPKKTSFPFFAWQCITLQFETRNLDFVIKDDNEMSRLIDFLVQGINTIDGRNNSAKFYIDAAARNEIFRIEKKMNRKVQKQRDAILCASDEEYEDWLQLESLTKNQREYIYKDQEKEIYRQTSFKYLMMRVRSKISYYAFRKHMTVNEFIISQIARSYKVLTEGLEIPVSAPYSIKTWNLFEDILDAPMAKTIDGLMQLAHDPVIKKRKEQIYKYRELKLLGVRSVDQLDQVNQKGIHILFEKNIGDNDDEQDEENSMYQGKLERRKLINTGRTFCIDAKQEKLNKSDLFVFTDKSKCHDIYLKTKIDKDKNTQINMYEQRSYRVLLKYKFNRKVVENKLNKIKFMLGVGELQDVFYLKAVLLKKSLIKQQFVLDIEHQQEVYIPDTLSCDIYPYSYRYYDPIISITNRIFDSKSKMYHCLKTDFYLKKLQGKDFKKAFLERFGALTTDKTRPLQFSHAQMKEIAQRNVKVTQTKHSISLQKSRYLMVESTEQGLQKLAHLQTYVLERKLDKDPGTRTIQVLEDQQLELRFCHCQEVNEKRQKFIIFKQQQFIRHDHLKNQGQKLYTSLLLERYIKENFDELYLQRSRDLNYNPEKGAQKNLDMIPYDQLSDRQKNMLDRDRAAYDEWLFRYAENLVQARRSRIRIKSIEECVKECGPLKPFENKNNYIEQKIESTYNYFQIMDDVEHTGFETERDRKKKQRQLENKNQPKSEWRMRMDELQEIERVRKRLRIVERQIMKQQARRMAALDNAVVSQMSERNLKTYIAHKGYMTNMRQVSMQNLKDLVSEEEMLRERQTKKRNTLNNLIPYVQQKDMTMSVERQYVDNQSS